MYKPHRSKYGAKKTTIDGIVFDSQKEAVRYQELILMQRSGLINGLQRQVEYVLIPVQREPDVVGPKGGLHKGKLLEKKCSYYADFVYKIPGKGITIVEDVKGVRTPEYIIKRKLMLYKYNIKIVEV